MSTTKDRVLLLNTPEAAYIAGIIDGEGSIQINPAPNKQGNPYWGLTLQVSSNCHELLEWMMSTCEGRGSVTAWKSKLSAQRKTSYNWRTYAREAVAVLMAVRPWMIVKAEHADIAVEFMQLKGKPYERISAEIREKRNNLAMQLRTLNRRYGKGVLGVIPDGVR